MQVIASQQFRRHYLVYDLLFASLSLYNMHDSPRILDHRYFAEEDDWEFYIRWVEDGQEHDIWFPGALFDNRGLLTDYLVSLGFPPHSDYSRLHELDCDDDHNTASLEVAVGSDDQSTDVSVADSDGSGSKETISDIWWQLDFSGVANESDDVCDESVVSLAIAGESDIWGQFDYSDATDYSEDVDDDEGAASLDVAGGSDAAAFSDSTLVANEDPVMDGHCQ